MGSSGGSLTTRSTAGLRGLMESAGFTEVEDGESPAEGWQVADFAEYGRRSVADLVRQTGAPAILVSFLDSDVAFVEAVTPEGGTWEAVLNRDMADDYGIPLDRFPVGAAAREALAWATAAGLTADEELLHQALTGAAAFAEELSSLLFTALGLSGRS
ncbi:hypothetical protein OG379_08515 [Streptomyces sp. NBC_01166]|uniref:hypothetical protein n=1 Tax=Streptomyces sp. NBC_01166 TaxID=2903755 RepID=UPI003866DD52|nr:hypothetical protein OG379_08515 [Streptomyces sp. NBC_01166]